MLAMLLPCLVQCARVVKPELLQPFVRNGVTPVVDDLFKDLDYINEMKQLEEQELSGQRSLHVVLFLKFLASRISSELCQVPISGLVIGYFCRLENECKTVLEVWEPVRYARSAATKVQRPELHKVSTMICCGHTLAPI